MDGTEPTVVERAEIGVAEALAPIRDTPGERALGDLTEFTDQPPLYAAAGGIIAAGLATGNARTQRLGARFLAAHVVAIAIKNVFKLSIDRTRPLIAAEQGRYERGKGERFQTEFNSFPSGHTASAIAVARAFGREYPNEERTALIAASALSAAQVVRSKHYITDVIAGAAIGVVAEALVDKAFRRFHPDVPEGA